MSDDQARGAYGAGHSSATLGDIRLADAELLRCCTVQRIARGGPGGQHANKTGSCVRLIHRSGITVEAGEHREGAMNRATALQRLRLALACAVRGSADPVWLLPHVQAGRLRCGPAARSWPLVAAVLLDLLHAHAGELRPAASAAGVSTTQLARALAEDQPVRRAADAIRAAAGLPGLRA